MTVRFVEQPKAATGKERLKSCDLAEGAQMINWDEFEHIHVIKKLRHILSSWWNVDVIFTDERMFTVQEENEVEIFEYKP